ncbi:hypothetical protein LZZ85_22465 [Terrimonas sp. NA20]|uniref:Uncharacterized protein n=1 Tax=Terrimonas ginsenosidimutans TaxID=2908004 RepID=A0ABS9KXI6_9BACT|nr:hypothetical protein [Terrimonas ginsenosidimutans]MCG2617077.1 hypothetical protein [Terrimonas ginsenosidimutans]
MPKPILRFPFLLNYSTLFLLLLMFIIIRCKKERSPVKEDNSISIHFSPSTISFDRVDSAVVILTKGASLIRRNMIRDNRLLKADLNDLEKGEWTTEIRIYARILNDNYQRRYDLTQNIGIVENGKGIRLSAATGLFNDQWKPRVIVATNDHSVVLTAALDPNDPYTDMVISNDKWDYVYVDRTALYKADNGEQRTDGGNWECDGDCYTDGNFQFEQHAFLGFSQRMANKNWLRSEVFGLVMNQQTGEELNLYYLFNR